MSKERSEAPKTSVWCSKGSQRSIGVVCPSYGIEHVTYSLQPEGFQFFKIPTIRVRVPRKNSNFWDMNQLAIGFNYDLLHSFNIIPISKLPFVMSFEMELPYYLGNISEKQMKFGLDRLESSRCRGLLGFSDVAARQARDRFIEIGRPVIANKITTFRGGVPASQFGPRQPPDKAGLRFLFVGSDGLRKGIYPTYNALKKLRSGGLDVHLTVVSAIPDQTYVLRHGKPDVAALKENLKQECWIDYHKFQDPVTVRRLMHEHDIFILPTLDETLGWVLIEAAFEGMAIISTDIFAAPELVPDGGGALLNVPLGPDRRWSGLKLSGNDQLDAWAEVNNLLERQIINEVNRLSANRDLIGSWGKAATRHVTRFYDIEVASKQLETIYREQFRTENGPTSLHE